MGQFRLFQAILFDVNYVFAISSGDEWRLSPGKGGTLSTKNCPEETARIYIFVEKVQSTGVAN